MFSAATKRVDIVALFHETHDGVRSISAIFSQKHPSRKKRELQLSSVGAPSSFGKVNMAYHNCTT